MSIGNVSNVTPASPVQNSSIGGASPRAAESSLREAISGGAVTQGQLDEVTQQPKAPRFPWLSRLSAELEATAKQKPAFPPAPVLGDNLDHTA